MGLLHMVLLFVPCPHCRDSMGVPFRPGRLAVRRGLS